jgi:pimeloyl-ACP methyl ester carboxylesterase
LVDAARTFVDYWSGPGTWSGLRREAQSALVRWLPHATLHFEALLCATTRLADAQPDGPVLVLRGEHAPGPSRLIADLVATTLAGKPAECIRGAGHMGPLTHADTVNERIARHLRDAEGRSTWPPSTTSCGALAKPPGAGQTTFITGERPRKDLSPTEDQPHLI